MACFISMLMVAGLLSRIWLIEYPNFKPIVAIAIFFGFYFQRNAIAFVSVLGMMIVSDVLLGFYEWPIMASVYASIGIAFWIGYRTNKLLQSRSAFGKMVGVSIAATVASISFFLWTNAAVVLAGWYPTTISGLLSSYAAGLPFLKYSLAGDCLFTAGIFSGYFLLSKVNSMNGLMTLAPARITQGK